MSKVSAFSALFTVLMNGWLVQAQAASPPSGFAYCGSQGDQSCCYHVVPTWWCPSDKRIETGTCSVSTQRFGALSGTLYKCLDPSKAGSPAKGGKIIPLENTATVARSKAALRSIPRPVPGPSVRPLPSGFPVEPNEDQECDGDEDGTCTRGETPTGRPNPKPSRTSDFSWPPANLPKTAVPLTGKCGATEVSEVFGSKAFVTRAGVLFFDPLDPGTVAFMRIHGSDSLYCQVSAQDAVEFATQVENRAGDAEFDRFVGPYAPTASKNGRTRLLSARYGCSLLPNTSHIDVTAAQSNTLLGSLRRVDGPRGFSRISGVSERGNSSPLAAIDFAPNSLGGYVFSGSCKDGSPAFRGLNDVNGIASQTGGISPGGSGSGSDPEKAGDAGGSFR